MDPIRTCVGCRQRDNRAAMLRVVIADKVLVADERGCAPGRGCYVHESVQCLNQAVSRRAFSRALRVATVVDTTHIENRLKLIMDHS